MSTENMPVTPFWSLGRFFPSLIPTFYLFYLVFVFCIYKGECFIFSGLYLSLSMRNRINSIKSSKTTIYNRTHLCTTCREVQWCMYDSFECYATIMIKLLKILSRVLFTTLVAGCVSCGSVCKRQGRQRKWGWADDVTLLRLAVGPVVEKL